MALAAAEAQTADIAQLKDTVSQLGAMMMEMRDVVAELQAGDHEEDENGEDAGTGESILRGQEPKVKVKEDIVAWENPSARKIWLISGVRPVVWGMKREELQAVLSDVALVTPAVTSQVAQCSAFNVSDYLVHATRRPRGSLGRSERLGADGNARRRGYKSGRKGCRIGGEHGARGGPTPGCQDRR